MEGYKFSSSFVRIVAFGANPMTGIEMGKGLGEKGMGVRREGALTSPLPPFLRLSPRL